MADKDDYMSPVKDTCDHRYRGACHFRHTSKQAVTPEFETPDQPVLDVCKQGSEVAN